MAALAGFARDAPEVRQFIYDGRPFALHPWGIQGALGCLYKRGGIRLSGVEDAESQTALRGGAPVAVLSWDTMAKRLTIAARTPGTPDAAYIRMDRSTPLWQLDDGWYPLEGGFRWAKPVATAHLHRPAEARSFELKVNISPGPHPRRRRRHGPDLRRGNPGGLGPLHLQWLAVIPLEPRAGTRRAGRSPYRVNALSAVQ